MSSTAPRAASPAATSSMSAHMRDLNRASFEGVMISALAYGMHIIP
jgi:hypothetical protein